MTHPATKKAVRAYVAAFEAAPGFSVQIAPSKGAAGVALRREWTGDDLLAGLDFLSAHNARGLNIYARPRGTRYVLIDDITRETAKYMVDDGLEPRLLLETSPSNLAGWLDLGPGLTVEEATEAARIVAGRYGGDPASTDARHLSRMPGFTNRKPLRRQTNGDYPFVKIAGGSRAIARSAHNLKQEARAAATLRVARESAAAAAPRDVGAGPGGAAYAELYASFSCGLAGKSLSQIDFTVSLRALRAGHSPTAVELIISSGSDIAARKATGLTGLAAAERVAKYVETTVRRAAERVRQ